MLADFGAMSHHLVHLLDRQEPVTSAAMTDLPAGLAARRSFDDGFGCSDGIG